MIGLGDLARAEALVRRLEARADALPRPWILAVSARSRGLLNAAAATSAALADCQRALAAHETLDMPAELGRTLLALGRAAPAPQRAPARRNAWAGRSRYSTRPARPGGRRWPGRTGPGQGRRGSARPAHPHRAAGGRAGRGRAAQPEIAARLFLSGKTVEANLSRIYRKLGVRSRTELAATLAGTGQPGQPGQPGERVERGQPG